MRLNRCRENVPGTRSSRGAAETAARKPANCVNSSELNMVRITEYASPGLTGVPQAKVEFLHRDENLNEVITAVNLPVSLEFILREELASPRQLYLSTHDTRFPGLHQ